MIRIVLIVCFLADASICVAQEAKPDQLPRIIVAAPLAITAGTPVKLVLRGLHLNDITEVKIVGFDLKPEIASKGKAPVPQNYDAKKVGDSVAEIKFMLPAETPAGMLSLIATSPADSSPVYKVMLAHAGDLIEEKEPNDGFKAAQMITAGKIVVGTIQDPRNVDVFELKAEAGQKLTVTVRASQVGSLLDPVLTLYDAAGQIVAASDDADGRDPRLETTATKSGSYFLSLQDANDSGGLHFVYLLKVVP